MGRIEQKWLIAFGSNENSVHGDVRETVNWAVRKVAALSFSPPICSRLYKTPAFPAGSGPDFINGAMQIAADLSPQDVLSELHAIEAEALRTRERRWGQRTLDLDLIAAGQAIMPDPAVFASWRDLPLDEQAKKIPDTLVLPHPRLQDRGFVLVPLCDVAPDWQHPVSGLTVREMCAALPAEARNEVVPVGVVGDV